MSDPSDTPFRSAEEWLAAKGIRRETIEVPAEPAPEPEPDRTEVSAREAVRLATEAPVGVPDPEADGEPAPPNLEDLVSRGLAYVRRSTAQAPKSEQRLRDKLAERDYPAVAIDAILRRCRADGTVDDAAMARALTDEGRAKGHAPFRIRRDLERRGFDAATIERAVAPYEAEDPEAQAFELAKRKAASCRSVPAETAFRRVAAYVARRGYTEGIARKVAREAVFDAREDERIVGR